MQRPAIIALAALFFGAPALADEELADSGGSARILVTIEDPGIGRSLRRGAPRPGYSRHRGRYEASPDVRRQARELAIRYPIRILEEWPIVPLGVHCIVYVVEDGASVESLLETLRAQEKTESAQPMQHFEARGSIPADRGDPYADVQHAIDILGLRAAHRWSTGDGIRVAIIDTGADLGHDDLANQVDEFRDFVGDEPADAFSERHGTAVAGVIAARRDNAVGIVGVAPAARASVLRACWHTAGRAVASCNTLTIAKALVHAIDSGADVVNLSLNGPSDPLLERLVGTAMRGGAIVVAAAPAEPGSGGRRFPSSLAGVITVGAYETLAPGAQVSPSLLAAPGVDILVLVPGDGYDFASGSSLAAAHVSGIVSLLLARKARLASSDIVELLVHSRHAANGSVHACRALAALLGETGCDVTASAGYSRAIGGRNVNRISAR